MKDKILEIIMIYMPVVLLWLIALLFIVTLSGIGYFILKNLLGILV